MDGLEDDDPAVDRRGAVPRHHESDTGGDPQVHVSPRHGRDRRASRARGAAHVGATAPQPDGALPQAPAPRRAERGGHERAFPRRRTLRLLALAARSTLLPRRALQSIVVATTTKRGTTQPAGILKRLVVGRALASHMQEHQLLPKALALPVFASDQLSSVAYATEQMMLVLVLAGAAALSWMLPLGIGIALLLAVVIASYRQTCRAYPQGGGSYIVARENLGTVPGLVA